MTETREAKVREQFEKWAKAWFLDLKRTELAGGIMAGSWTYEAMRVQHAWAGWQAAEKIYRLAGREDGIEDRWVSVDDQLPGVSYNYLVCDSDGDVEEASFFKDNGEWRSVATYGIDSEHEDLHPVYWQALPTAPRSLSSKKEGSNG